MLHLKEAKREIDNAPYWPTYPASCQRLFEPGHKGSDTRGDKKDVSLLLMSSGFPGRRETNRCTLYRSDEFSGLRASTKTTTPTVKQ
jgi:hypothetical protein